LQRRSSEWISVLIILTAVTLVFALTWVNYRFAVQNPGGNDFLSRWLGIRKFLMEGASPYSDETTQEIQTMMYGRLAQVDEDQVLFVYPFYSIYIFAPFALIADYDMARAVWMTTLEVAVLMIAIISLSLSRWQVRPIALAIFLIFAVLWYYSIRPIVNGNGAVVSALMITVALLLIRQEQDGLAGLLLAMASIKPQMVILLIPFVLLWSISRQRRILFWSILGSLALLVASTSLLIPNWTWQNLVQVISYPGYTLPGTPGAILTEWLPGVGSKLGWAFTIFLIGSLIWEWRAAWGMEYRWFLWTACLTLVITNLIGIRTATANYLAMLPALVLVLATWDRYWGIIGRVLIVLSILLLFFGVWWLFLSTIQMLGQATQHPVMFFPLPMFLLVTLYWIRWWLLRPERPWLETIRRSVRSKIG